MGKKSVEQYDLELPARIKRLHDKLQKDVPGIVLRLEEKQSEITKLKDQIAQLQQSLDEATEQYQSISHTRSKLFSQFRQDIFELLRRF